MMAWILRNPSGLNGSSMLDALVMAYVELREVVRANGGEPTPIVL
ncbi:hypothetical protein E9232_003988 [Inquilinus ginsengisoli]|uniref:Uncharacterized protein n=1 Tax=Inquilinus ginsengisoli TaxID=363840 RepID=A0ABU1JV75_9PROT|nr:hypothetical protein [Inquilinus ginsengisoli]